LKPWITTQGPQRAASARRRLAAHIRRLLACGLISALLASLCPFVGRAQEGAGEYEVKAAFLFNFAKFIDWPDNSFAGPQSPFSVCVLGLDPFGRALDDTLKGKMIAGRPVAVLRLREAAAARQCQIAFVSASEKSRFSSIFSAMRGSSVLLVGDTENFAASGGAIQFTFEENHIRFTINTDAAERAKLQISSKLLALATIVRDTPGRGKG
jgi:YfiR/HmsC-like